jgi:transcriptional regulator with XRE-family HTH domain
MTVAAVGTLVRAYRRASGISQKDLAAMVGISRATLNYLESGRDIEIGAAKLLALLTALGVPLGLPSEVDRAGDDAILDGVAKAASGKGRKKLPRKVLVEALSSGRMPVGYEGHIAHVVETAAEPAVLAMVRSVSASAGLPAAAVWRNGRSLAKAAGSSRSVWLAVG